MVDLVEDELFALHRLGYPDYTMENIQGDLSLAGHIFLASPADPMITVVRDASVDTWYLAVEGQDDPVDRMADALTGRLPMIEVDELRQASGSQDATPRDLVRLSLGSSQEADENTIEIFTSWLHSNRPEMRGAAMKAISLTQWPELIDKLESAVDAEPDPTMKEFGAVALDAMRRAVS
ncbi:hypothetical protein ACFWMR_32295 [Amycolatopsis thailandensis]|uniref:hypothetical protein n=1 Tax=Amycolatopsis thailandensis TaxID=589330 RepID=UPI0036601FE8